MSDRLHIATHKGVFTVDRGSAGWEIVKVDFLGDNATLLLQGHDELVVEAPEAQVDAIAAAMVEETRELMARLPEPSAEETTLIEQHGARIEAVLGDSEAE